MEEQELAVMMCDRIEDGRICVLVGDGGRVLSVPMDALSVVPTEKEFYTVKTEENGRILLVSAPKEKEKRLHRIRALRHKLLCKKK